MVDEHPSAIRIDIESVDEDGDCLELMDTHGVYYTDMRNWETIAADAWARSKQWDFRILKSRSLEMSNLFI